VRYDIDRVREPNIVDVGAEYHMASSKAAIGLAVDFVE
jgi:hypothetical protein